MTKKDFIFTASLMAEIAKDFKTRNAYIEACKVFARRFQSDNPRFNPSRFFIACGFTNKELGLQ